jgi:hypothetical protein
MGSLYNPVGLFRILLCQAGKLLDAGGFTGLVPLGSRDDDAYLTVDPYGTTTTRGRSNRNKETWKAYARTKQFRLRDLEWALFFLKNGFDCQLVGEPVSAPTDGGVFNFLAATHQMGLDFVYRITDGVRDCDITLERAMNYEVSKAFMDASDAYAELLPVISADVISGGNERGENLTNWQAPFFYQIKAPNDTVLFEAENIVSRSLEISTVSNKTEFNVSRVKRLAIKQEVTLDTVKVSDWMALKNKALSPSVVIREYMGNGSNYEEFNFGSNVLSLETSNKKGENEGFMKITIAGEVTLGQFSFGYGAANGGTADDDYAGGKATVE